VEFCAVVADGEGAAAAVADTAGADGGEVLNFWRRLEELMVVLVETEQQAPYFLRVLHFWTYS
jgi:hypothetical protein